MSSGPIKVFGIGHPWRRDDGAGRIAVRRLLALPSKGGALANAEIVEIESPLEMLHAWAGTEHVVIIDAVSSGAPPGTLHIVHSAQGDFNQGTSTHGFGVFEALAIARNLGQLPQRVEIYGIEGQDFGHGEGLTPEVERAVNQLVERLVLELGS